MTKKESKYFNLAKAVAECSEHPNFHIGCLIINQHKIISQAFNSKKSHPLQKKLNNLRFPPDDTSQSFIHAELSAIIRASRKELVGASMYIYRENFKHQLSCCRPCPACMAKIKEVGIKTIYYTTDDGFCKEVLK